MSISLDNDMQYGFIILEQYIIPLNYATINNAELYN